MLLTNKYYINYRLFFYKSIQCAGGGEQGAARPLCAAPSSPLTDEGWAVCHGSLCDHQDEDAFRS